MKKICIINTGGTIAMRQSKAGLQPDPGYMTEQMRQMSELQREGMPSYEVIEYDPLLDSSNMTPSLWLKIAQDVALQYDNFDGFVVLHGTDTMAHTSSALPFMLRGLAKPVIVTGAQLPLAQIRNDARENLKTAMILAARYAIPEVCLFFGEVLLRGCRASKTSATKLDAFDSPNYPIIGSAETTLEVFADRLLPTPPTGTSLQIEPIHRADVATFRLFPGMSVDILRNMLQRPLQALILESYGVGNGPSNNPEFLKAIKSAVDQGTVIVNCTQCRHGCVTQTNYATGRALSDAGVVSGRDMTIEAALAKLMYLLSRDFSADEVRKKVSENLVGEISPK